MASTSITFRMDEELKKNLEKTCQELGMSVTTAFTIFSPLTTSWHSTIRKRSLLRPGVQRPWNSLIPLPKTY